MYGCIFYILFFFQAIEAFNNHTNTIDATWILIQWCGGGLCFKKTNGLVRPKSSSKLADVRLELEERFIFFN